MCALGPTLTEGPRDTHVGMLAACRSAWSGPRASSIPPVLLWQRAPKGQMRPLTFRQGS